MHVYIYFSKQKNQQKKKNQNNPPPQKKTRVEDRRSDIHVYHGLEFDRRFVIEFLVFSNLYSGLFWGVWGWGAYCKNEAGEKVTHAQR